MHEEPGLQLPVGAWLPGHQRLPESLSRQDPKSSTDVKSRRQLPVATWTVAEHCAVAVPSTHFHLNSEEVSVTS